MDDTAPTADIDPPLIEDAIDEHRAREDFGITTHTMGTWMPEASHRPIPIVWFGGALTFQMIQLAVLTILLGSKPAIFLAATTGLASFVIGWWAWDGKMETAGSGWKAATVTMLGASWLLFAANALG